MKKVILQRPGKVVLRDHRLGFVGLGTRKMHIKSTGGAPQNPLVDIGHQTLCGLDLATGILTKERGWSTEEVCRKCLTTASHFPPGWVEEVEQ